MAVANARDTGGFVYKGENTMGNQNTNNPKGGQGGGMNDDQRAKQGQKSGTTNPAREQDDDSRTGKTKNDQQGQRRNNG
jgi:hypothetical protein